jgi:hypothetical protein
MCCSAFPPHAQQVPANLTQRSAAQRFGGRALHCALLLACGSFFAACVKKPAVTDFRILFQFFPHDTTSSRYLKQKQYWRTARAQLGPEGRLPRSIVTTSDRQRSGNRNRDCSLAAAEKQTAQPRSQRRQSFRFRFPQKRASGQHGAARLLRIANRPRDIRQCKPMQSNCFAFSGDCGGCIARVCHVLQIPSCVAS